jgi:hypothetical protein
MLCQKKKIENRDKMCEFLGRYKLLKLTPEETEDLNSPERSKRKKKIQLVI